jgi:hypothetical protein
MKKRIFYTLPAFLLVFGFLIGGCDEKDPRDDAVEGVTVTVSPATASVAHGGGETFTAEVKGEDNPDQTVKWTVEGAKAGTTISDEGVLTVATNETADKLTVRATSAVDTTKSGTATVTVTAATATVTSVTVSPATANVNKNQTRHFDAAVTGTNNPAKTVIWSIVEAGKHSGTTINSSGLLTVSANETLTTLTVKATSTVDTGKSGTATVTVANIVIPSPSLDNRIKDPDTQTAQLSNPSFALVTKPHGGGNKWLIQAQNLGYETWDEDTSGDANFRWFGQNQGGGAAFRAEWGDPNRPKDFLARVGYFWDNENPRKPHTAFGNIYCGFNFTKSGQYRGNFSYIGIYGWSRNPLVEYYIVENSYGNAWNDHAGYIARLNQDTIQGTEMTSYTLDGSVYKVYKKTRTGPSIAGNQTFTQYFSIRQNARTSGTISITEHFKEWEDRDMNLGTMYECKFKVEIGGTPSQSGGITTGFFDASFIQFYRANDDGTIIEITQ